MCRSGLPRDVCEDDSPDELKRRAPILRSVFVEHLGFEEILHMDGEMADGGFTPCFVRRERTWMFS